jgi:hypothetical protein
MMGKLQVGINWLFWRALALALLVVLLGLAIAANRYEPAYQSGELA